MSKHVLVTGGAGYIGANVCQLLHKQGFIPVVFDDLSTGHQEFVKWGPLIVGDLKNSEQISSVFQAFEIDTVFHFAAKAYVSESVINPTLYYLENILGSTILLDLFVKSGGKNFIFSSSCATYGNPMAQFIDEKCPQTPINPYGFTKLAVERLLHDLKRNHLFNFAILRYFNAAGTNLETGVGEIHNPETHLIPSMILASLRGQPFSVFGSDFSTDDGTAVRDYIHVSDLALAHLRALEFITTKKSDLICNLGTGKGTSILELVHSLKGLDAGFTFDFAPRRDGDPDKLVAANQLSKDILGLNYESSNIDNIISSSIAWIKQNESRFL